MTYVGGGTMLHRDTVGDEERITPTRLMLMNAGHTFQHEEEMTGDVPIEVLQIFIRPSAPDLEPRVQFHDFAEAISYGRWRIIAGPEGEAPLTLRAQAWVRDVRLGAGEALPIPDGDAPVAVRLVYVFAGTAAIEGVTLEAGDSLLLPAGPRTVEARGEADVVLFTTDPAAPVFAGGMFSGNILRA